MPTTSPDHQYVFTLAYGEFSARLEISGSYSLYDLAELLTEAVGFDFDHAFGFYDGSKNPYRSTEKYTLFADMGEPEDNEPGVNATPVSSVFREGKRMLFLFDYGDDWFFDLRRDEVQQRPLKRRVKRILKQEGTPPVQYPDYDEDEDEDDDLE